MLTPESHLGSKEYNGGIFPVWINLKEPVRSAGQINWKNGNSKIAYRTQKLDTSALKNNPLDTLILADTAFIYWDAPPPPFVKIDSILTSEKNDSIKSWRTDTTYYYRDTLFAIIDGFQSESITIEVKNILPKITSLSVGGLAQPGDSLLVIAAHPGDKLEIKLSLEKQFNPLKFHPIVELPAKLLGSPNSGSLKLRTENDSLFVWEWSVPNEVIADSSLTLKIRDSGGYGERIYKVYLVVYTEFGSMWVASERELVKYSPAGAEVARISEGFGQISDLAVNSKTGKLFVTDQSTNKLSIYDTYGKLLYKSDDLFKNPTGIAIDVESNYAWVADAIDPLAKVFEGRLSRFVLIGDSLKPTEDAEYKMSGPIKGLSADQFKRDFLWFAIPESDTVGFFRNIAVETEPKIMDFKWNRPSMVFYDGNNGVAWIADSSRVVGIDSSGIVKAEIKGFGFVSSVSAAAGLLWVSDILGGKVYRFKGPFIGSQTDLKLTIMDGTPFDFIAPAFVSAFGGDGGAWVVDREAGSAIRLDSKKEERIASGTGLKLPYLGKVLQVVE
ncbi:hypothetical protein AGMMS49938_06730 [Fibrobacterales bacterium]|nr:hypothetical protein AGMMS49938_06730 [Fibrobacterales bacterium]